MAHIPCKVGFPGAGVYNSSGHGSESRRETCLKGKADERVKEIIGTVDPRNQYCVLC